MTDVVNRRTLVRACKRRGWMVQPAALSAMLKYLNVLEEDETEIVLEELSRHVDKHTKIITEAMWVDAMESNHNDDNDLLMMPPTSGDGAALEIVDAFETPRLVYDSMRKTFRAEEEKWPLLGTVADKINMMAQRYDLVHQRMLRHEVFRSRSSHADRKEEQLTLTPIESLLGKQNSDQPVLVLGILVQVEEGQYYLEDPSGRAQVSFCNAKAVDGFYVMENSILLVEATFQDEVLFVQCVGPPFIEQRNKSLQILQQQVRHKHFLPTNISAANGSPFVVLSDVHLDQPLVLNLLEELFQSYTDTNPSKLPVFCFMGNFTSSPLVPAYQYWEELAILIAKYTVLAQHAQFVFIPGPNDTKSEVLPLAPLSQGTVVGLKRMMQSYQIDNIHWASNPCRIRQNGKEIVFFRHDVLSCMLQNQVRLPQMNNDSEDTHRSPHSKMIKTILDQGHLMPVTRAPIYWNYDHALRLYPLPDALVLGCSAEEDYEIYEECDAIQPGSFSKNGTYAIFSTKTDDDDDDEVMSDDDEQDGANSRVQFFQVKETESS